MTLRQHQIAARYRAEVEREARQETDQIALTDPLDELRAAFEAERDGWMDAAWAVTVIVVLCSAILALGGLL